MSIFMGCLPLVMDRLLQARMGTLPFPIHTCLAHEVYHLDLTRAWREEEETRLSQLLRAQLLRADVLQVCPSKSSSVREKGASSHTRYLWVWPRLGTISPWSSKATMLLAHCGLGELVRRVERGVFYQLTLQQPWEADWLEQVGAVLSDAMTEMVCFDRDSVSDRFKHATPQPLSYVPMLSEGIEALEKANERQGWAFSPEEIKIFYAYFKQLKRDPTDVECMMFGQVNSEHCRHKIFNATWHIDGKPVDRTLFDMIRETYHTHPEGIELAYRDNAAILTGGTQAYFCANPAQSTYGYTDLTTHWVIKAETHNHPTAVSPWPGAATGVGGEIRDESATGRGAVSRAGLIGFSVSDLCLPNCKQPWECAWRALPHLADARTIMLQAPLGSSDFSNAFGRPTLCGYFRTYSATIDGQFYGYHKPIVLAGGMGQIQAAHASKYDLPAGTRLVVLGGAAMPIGLGGGAISSLPSNRVQGDLDFASVQRGNPEMQRRCQEVIEACLSLGSLNPILSIHDVGAGGLANAIPEIVHDCAKGAHVQLRAIVTADAGMSPLALWCNESQERYILAIAPDHMDAFQAIAHRENCPYADVGVVTAARTLRVDDAHFDNTPVEMDLSFLLDQKQTMARDATFVPSCSTTEIDTMSPAIASLDFKEAVRRVLQLPAVGSKEFLITIADRSVGGLVARDQMVGPWQVPVSDVAVIADGYRTYAGKAMAVGERSPVAVDAPAISACLAVGEVLTNLLAAPIEQISTIQLSANWMAASGDPKREGALYQAVHAVRNFCVALGLTIPVGKDSLSMQTMGRQSDGSTKRIISPLSLVVSGFAPVADVRNVLTPQLVDDQDTVLLLVDLGTGTPSMRGLAGSALAHVFQRKGGVPPAMPDATLLKAFVKSMATLRASGDVLAYHDRSDGGLFVTLAEMAFASHMGLRIDLEPLGSDGMRVLFDESLGCVIQIANHREATVRACFAAHDLEGHVYRIGTPQKTQRLVFRDGERCFYEANRTDLQALWSNTSHHMRLLRDHPAGVEQVRAQLLSDDEACLTAHLSFDLNDLPHTSTNPQHRPRVAILREQGVNGQREMAAAFDYVGFESVDVTMQDLREGQQTLRDFSCLAVCGGFSYGDVLGAGRGWAAMIRYHTHLSAEFRAFFERKDTLTFGACNGCQMLSALRDFIPGAAHFPDFLTNQSQRFEARLINVRIVEKNCVWLRGMGDSYLPIVVSHAEGRVATLLPQGEAHVVLRYADRFGQATTRYPDNPNGSLGGTAGICSTDGRVLITMPHPERIVRNIQLSWAPSAWRSYEASPWLQLFRRAKEHLSTSL